MLIIQSIDVVPLQIFFLLCLFICATKEVMAEECNAWQYLRDHFDCIVTALYALPCLIDYIHTHTEAEANPNPAGCFLTRFVLQPRL